MVPWVRTSGAGSQTRSTLWQGEEKKHLRLYLEEVRDPNPTLCTLLTHTMAKHPSNKQARESQVKSSQQDTEKWEESSQSKLLRLVQQLGGGGW